VDRDQPSPLRFALAGLIALAAAVGIGRFIYTPILPFMVDGLGLSQGQAGIIASANYAGYLAGALFGILPIAVGARRNWVLGALAASAATTALMAMTTAVAAFVALRFAGGVASAFVFVFAASLVLDRPREGGRDRASAVHFAGVGTGIATSALIVTGLAALGAAWRELWLGGAAVSCLGLAAVALLAPREREAQPTFAPPPGRGTRAGLARLVVAYGLYGFGYVITATFLVGLVRLTPDMRAIEPVVWLLVGLSAAPSIAPWNRLARRIGVFRAFAVACLVEAAGVAASVLWPSIGGAILAAVLLGGTFVAITALGVAGARKLSAADPRRVIALITASFGLGQIVGPAFAGYLHDLSGSFLAPTLAAAAALVIAAALTFTIQEES
jgi:predicted MFS family arabinose efflux permease